jgi:hypothetical protein
LLPKNDASRTVSDVSNQKPLSTILWIWIALMSGVLSLVREVIGLYGWQQARSVEVFWICARIAFIVSAVMLYRIQNKTIKELEQNVEEEKDKRGRPMPIDGAQQK